MNKICNWLKYSYIYLILLIIYIPLVIVIILSFNGVTQKGNINVNIGKNIYGDDSLWASYAQLSQVTGPLLNSLLIGIVVTPISVFIALLTCFGLWNSRKVYIKSVLGISNFSILSPEVITGLGLSILFISTFLPLGLSLGMVTIILTHISFCTPYAIITIHPRMEKINKNWILASYDLGCKRWATFFKIVVPFLLPTIIGASIMVFAMSFDDFVITNLVRGSTQTISTQLYLMRKGIKGWTVALGAIMLFVILGVVSVITVHKQFIQHRKKMHKLANGNNGSGTLRRWKKY